MGTLWTDLASNHFIDVEGIAYVLIQLHTWNTLTVDPFFGVNSLVLEGGPVLKIFT